MNLSVAPLPPPEATRLLRALEEAVGGTVLGQTEVIREVLCCVAGGGHALLEGPPGVRTTLRHLVDKALSPAPGLLGESLGLGPGPFRRGERAFDGLLEAVRHPPTA